MMINKITPIKLIVSVKVSKVFKQRNAYKTLGTIFYNAYKQTNGQILNIK